MQKNVLDYLNNIVTLRPDKTAYSNGEDSLTFAQVYEQSRAIGTWICHEGIYGEPIVVFMDKHPKEVVAFFGVIASGNYYVPIDEEMPQARIRKILDKVNPKIILCDEKTRMIAQSLIPDGKVIVYDDICHTQTDGEALKEIYDKAIDTDPVYIVFTSGSTGVPKGVVASHRSVIDYVEDLSEVLEFHENTIFGNQTPLYFDACLKEIYPTLKFGATTYLIPRNLFLFPIRLVEYLNEHRINTICWVVSALTMVSAVGTFQKVRPEYLRTVAFGSEVFPARQFHIWQENLPDAVFTNLYGPTEGTGMCCYYRVDHKISLNETIPIGKPFPNREILLLDHGQRVPNGETGEICIRGSALAMGYYNEPQKTAEAFVQNPLNSVYPEIIYRTGDLGRYNEYGELVFVSRRDNQIKHMGHRIELGEIEANVNEFEEITLAACVFREENQMIELHYVGQLTEKDMILRLRKKLPRYMMPNRVVKREDMPFTENGKIDRLALKGEKHE